MRTPWQVTWSVWQALFMRDLLSRTGEDRLGWFWMFFEPLLLMGFMIGMRTVMGRTRDIIGADYLPWLLVGIIAFNLFRDGVTRSLGAIVPNQALFSYRQIYPIDPILIRNVVSGLLKTIVLLIMIFLMTFFGQNVLPDDSLGAIFIWLSLWLLGMGAGLVVSVLDEILSGVDLAIKMLMMPLFMLSGAMFPIQGLPHWIQEYLLYNPVLHGLELLRLDFFHLYHTMSGVDLIYLWEWIIILLTIGIMLHVRFGLQLKMK